MRLAAAAQLERSAPCLPEHMAAGPAAESVVEADTVGVSLAADTAEARLAAETAEAALAQARFELALAEGMMDPSLPRWG